MIDETRLLAIASEYGISLQAPQLQSLQVYAGLLLAWNQKINLTAITQPEEIEIKHFLDSLLLAAQPEIAGKLVDVGSGAGFPGLVVKIARPKTNITLMEPTGKRLNFLQEVSLAIAAPVKLVKERAEEAARKQWWQSFDVATARAVASLPALCEYCLPLVKTGGLFIAMKADVGEELSLASRAMGLLGGRFKEIRSYTLPDGSKRSLVFIEKVADTPKQYPRHGAVIAKRPL